MTREGASELRCRAMPQMIAGTIRGGMGTSVPAQGPATGPTVIAGYGSGGEVTMGSADRADRPPAGARRAGYGVAIGFSAALLFVLNGWPGWQAVPFLTSSTDQVLWLVNLSLAAGIAANIVYLAYDPPWVKSLGDLATTGIGLVTAIRVWQVFPFAVSSGWSIAVRTLLVVTIAGSCIALVVQIVSLARWLTGHTPHGGHVRIGH